MARGYSAVRMWHPSLDVPRGLISTFSAVNKFGRTTNADSGVATDIHDGANATDDLDVWVAPTAARVHQIASTQAADDGNPVGVGARTLRVYGLTGWGTEEVSEDITLNGVGDVPTVNSYVIIHRMKVLTKGGTNVNVGVITATADTNGTVTAQINAGQGQTQMAIYGIPSTQTAFICNYYASAIKNAAAVRVAVALLVNPEPDAELTKFLVKHTNGLDSTGTSYINHPFNPFFAVAGPAIIKVQVNASAADTDVSGGFDLVLVTN